MKRLVRRKDRKDLRDNGRIILAHGEVTGHCHEIVGTDVELPDAEFFEEPDGRRVLLALKPCVLRHQEHAPIHLDPDHLIQARQGDVLLTPLGPGAWVVTRQREYSPEAIRQVAD
jgi:hypothetical protein